MKIAVIHSFYSSSAPSGENSMVIEQVNALMQAGHQVRLISQSTDELREQPLYAIRSAFKTVSGYGLSPLREINAFRPDVIHVHNLFPNYGTGWLTQVQAPIVATLHNFRPLCANGLLFRDGKTCFDCPDGHPMSAVKHACYHDSSLASIPLTIRNARGPNRNELLRAASAIICLSSSAKDIYVKYGLDPAKIHVIPNGISVPLHKADTVRNDRWVAVGRLTPEKGFIELIDEWPDNANLDIIGDGPKGSLPENLPTRINHQSALPHDKLLSTLVNYNGLIFPSLCLEMQPTLVIEAMALGLPIVAREGNAGAKLVKTYGSGLTYESRFDLQAALIRVSQDSNNFALAGRAAFRERFQQSVWIDQLETVYGIVTETV